MLLVKPAPQLITTLLKDITVHCVAWKQDGKAEDYRVQYFTNKGTLSEDGISSIAAFLYMHNATTYKNNCSLMREKPANLQIM